MEENTQNKFKITKLFRGINFVGAIFLALIFRIDGIGHLVVYYLMYFYFWTYLTFIILEFRYIGIRKINFFKHFFTNWLILIGFMLPILTVIISRAIPVTR